MITNENKELAQHAMDFALKNGCQSTQIVLRKNVNSSFDVRDGKMEKLTQSDELVLNMSFYVDGRYGYSSTNRLDRAEIENLIKESITSIRYIAVDEARTLPDPSRYYKGHDGSLETHDASLTDVSPDTKKDLVMSVCNEMTGKDPLVISASASYSDTETFRYMLASNGFEGEKESSSCDLTANVSVKGDGDARPEDYWYDSNIFFRDLQKKNLGTKALNRVLKRIGSKKVESGSYDIVVENRIASRLLSPIMSSLDGNVIQQKASFLTDGLNKKVFGEHFTLKDEPQLKKTFGACYFDNEGVATHPMEVISHGVINTYYINTYAANKMKVAPTVSAPSVLTMPGGTKDCAGLIASVSKGIYITDFNGGNCNDTTGDFSFGIQGFLIQDGKAMKPVSEMNITGNMKTLWSNLADIGNDCDLTSSWRIPSLLFKEVNCSGL